MRRTLTPFLLGAWAVSALLVTAGAAPAAAGLRDAGHDARPTVSLPTAEPPARPRSRTRCLPSQAPESAPQTGGSAPPAAPAYFAEDFPVLTDSRLGTPLGGFGGLERRAPLGRTPVVFVHGNQADAQNWLTVMLQLQNVAGYTMQEMYAVSYNGLGNYYAGAPSGTPTMPDQQYVEQNPEGLSNGGHGAANDDEVRDLCRFVQAVQRYTGSRQVDIVAHSLGVTIVRQLMRLHPELADDVAAFVGIAGGNHGTTVCRGLEESYYGCDEIAPGTPWLERLNGARAQHETYGDTAWMTVYNGSEAGDGFFLDEDASSPQLSGADNRTFPDESHNDLRAVPATVTAYLAFLLAHGQAGPGAASDGTALAATIEAEQPDGRQGNLCGIPALTGPVEGCP